MTITIIIDDTNGTSTFGGLQFAVLPLGVRNFGTGGLNAFTFNGGGTFSVFGELYGEVGGIGLGITDGFYVTVGETGVIGALDRTNIDSDGIHSTIANATVENAGQIYGYSGIDAGTGAGFVLINSGQIAGNGPGVTAGVARIHNSGLITSASGDGLDLDGGEVFNTGEIVGGTYAIRSSGLIEITNRGMIAGDVALGDGDDLFDNDGGLVTGFIDMGAGADELIGGSGRERVMGGSGSDSFDLDAGKDIYLAGNTEGLTSDGNDDIDGGEGIDIYDASGITTRVVINLNESRANGAAIGIDHVVNVENIRGGATGDILVGDGGRNVIRGGNGNDSIAGLDGNDRIIGGNDNDTITGGDGRDVMTGGDGIDTFNFNSVTESGSFNPTRDSITDFVSGTDKIGLSAIDANTNTAGNQAFSFIGISAFTGVAGQLHFVPSNLHQVTVVEGDINGDSVADFQIALFGSLTLAAGDFIL